MRSRDIALWASLCKGQFLDYDKVVKKHLRPLRRRRRGNAPEAEREDEADNINATGMRRRRRGNTLEAEREDGVDGINATRVEREDEFDDFSANRVEREDEFDDFNATRVEREDDFDDFSATRVKREDAFDDFSATRVEREDAFDDFSATRVEREDEFDDFNATGIEDHEDSDSMMAGKDEPSEGESQSLQGVYGHRTIKRRDESPKKQARNLSSKARGKNSAQNQQTPPLKRKYDDYTAEDYARAIRRFDIVYGSAERLYQMAAEQKEIERAMEEPQEFTMTTLMNIAGKDVEVEDPTLGLTAPAL